MQFIILFIIDFNAFPLAACCVVDVWQIGWQKLLLANNHLAKMILENCQNTIKKSCGNIVKKKRDLTFIQMRLFVQWHRIVRKIIQHCDVHRRMICKEMTSQPASETRAGKKWPAARYRQNPETLLNRAHCSLADIRISAWYFWEWTWRKTLHTMAAFFIFLSFSCLMSLFSSPWPLQK